MPGAQQRLRRRPGPRPVEGPGPWRLAGGPRRARRGPRRRRRAAGRGPDDGPVVRRARRPRPVGRRGAAGLRTGRRRGPAGRPGRHGAPARRSPTTAAGTGTTSRSASLAAARSATPCASYRRIRCWSRPRSWVSSPSPEQAIEPPEEGAVGIERGFDERSVRSQGGTGTTEVVRRSHDERAGRSEEPHRVGAAGPKGGQEWTQSPVETPGSRFAIMTT